MITLVTGTGTDVGKTVATAAVAALASGRVAVVKPAQTGVPPNAPGDLAEVRRLAKITDTYEFARYPDPLSPHHAAVLAGQPPLDFADVARRIDDLAASYDHVVVEGAGGLLVPFDTDRGWTLADLAADLRAPLLVVTRPGLGTLNDTRLTVDRIAEEGLQLAGVLIGSWPADADLAMRANVADLQQLGVQHRLAGVLPADMAAMRDFRRQARAALGPQWGGTFDSRAFVARHHP